MAEEQGGDRVVVSSGSTAGSWSMTIDFERGVVSWTTAWGKKAKSGSRNLTPEEHKSLRACARRAYRAGDLEFRTQFADGCETFAMTFGGTTVTRRYETEGYGYDRHVEELLEFARIVT